MLQDGPVDYNLNRLGTLEFEHVIQALAIAELGMSVTTFGAGRDGGREATFFGRVSPRKEKSLTAWSGYGIAQAKALRFLGDELSDTKSIAAAVNVEFDAFVTRAGQFAGRVGAVSERHDERRRKWRERGRYCLHHGSDISTGPCAARSGEGGHCQKWEQVRLPQLRFGSDDRP